MLSKNLFGHILMRVEHHFFSISFECKPIGNQFWIMKVVDVCVEFKSFFQYLSRYMKHSINSSRCATNVNDLHSVTTLIP